MGKRGHLPCCFCIDGNRISDRPGNGDKRGGAIARRWAKRGEMPPVHAGGLRGSIAFIRVNIPGGQRPVSLPEDVGKRDGVVVPVGRRGDWRKRWQRGNWRWRQSPALSEDGVRLPVHALEPDRLAVGEKG